MAHEADPLTIHALPEAAELAREVNATGKARLVQIGDDVVRLAPAPRSAKSRAPRRPRRKSGVLTREDPLFGLIGIGASGIPGGVSGSKHDALARAYRPH